MGVSCSRVDGVGEVLPHPAASPLARLSADVLHEASVSHLRRSLFSGVMSEAQLSEFARFLTITQYPAEATIITKGKHVDALYIVGDGSIRMELGSRSPSLPALALSRSPMTSISMRHLDRDRVPALPRRTRSMSIASGVSSAAASTNNLNLLCVKHAGEYFGEETLLQAGRHSHDLSVVTAEPVQMSVLTRSAYERYLLLHPHMRDTISSIALSMESRLRQMPLFCDVDQHALRMLATMFRFVPLRADETLFREGDFDRDDGNKMYFLFQGEVRVLVDEQLPAGADGTPPRVAPKLLTTLTPGSFIGEVSMILDIPRTATITAVSSSLLLELSQTKFRHFLTLMPEILAKFQSMLMTYHIHLLYFLHNPIVLQSFTMHLRSEHSEENILFWLACRELRALDPSTVDQSQIDLQARAIETRFIGDQAPMQVNLKGTVEKKIRAGLKETPIKSTVFVDGECEIMALMETDSFGRFKQSDRFHSCIETVNSPWTSVLRKIYLL